MSELKTCTECEKRPTCKKLCSEAQEYINQDGDVFEIASQKTITVSSGNNMINQTSLHKTFLEEDDSGEGIINYVFSSENDSPFANFNPTHATTKIFIHRFIMGWQFKDIAEKFDISTDNAKSTYHTALQRFQDGLDILDQRKKLNQYAQYAMEQSHIFNQLNRNQKSYLLYTLFSLTADEISDLTGVEKKKVQKGVKYISEKLDTGKYDFNDLAIPGQWEKKSKANMMAGLTQNRKTA